MYKDTEGDADLNHLLSIAYWHMLDKSYSCTHKLKSDSSSEAVQRLCSTVTSKPTSCDEPTGPCSGRSKADLLRKSTLVSQRFTHELVGS